MIAHRLSTIETADNLAFIKDHKNVVTAAKGSAEYAELFESLKEHNYKHQQDDEEEEIDSPAKLEQLTGMASEKAK